MLVGFFLFSDTLTSSNKPNGSFHSSISFTFDHPVICKIIKFINQWDNSYQSVLDSSKFDRLVVDWSVEIITFRA